MPEQQQSRRRRTHYLYQPNSSTTILNSISWYLLLSVCCFFWGAYSSLREFSSVDNHRYDYTKQSTVTSKYYSLAYYQSYGYFDDISTDEWQRLRTIAKSGGMLSPLRTTFSPDYDGNDDDDTFWNAMPSNVFYGSGYDPNFSRRSEVRVGGLGDGPKFVCDPRRIPNAAKQNWRMIEGSSSDKDNNRRCLVYSIGCGGNFRFEVGLQKLLGANRCEIHIFDGTDYSAIVPKQMNIHFHNWGLRRDRGSNTNDDYRADENMAYPKSQSLRSAIKFMSLSQTMKILGHTDEVLDILKIDCEGCEWKAFMDWLGNSSVQSPRQVLIELHRSPAPYARDFFTEMKSHGYVIFHKEPNLPGCPRGDCIEYGFLKLNPQFYSDDS